MLLGDKAYGLLNLLRYKNILGVPLKWNINLKNQMLPNILHHPLVMTIIILLSNGQFIYT